MWSVITLLALGAVEAQTIDPARIEAVGAQADQEQREANNQHDWWLVSTSDFGIAQSRFYIDREAMTSMEPISRAWTDRYAIVSGHLIHDKVLIVAQCDDRNPQIQFRAFVSYRPGASPETNSDLTWRDVVPGSSQQTLWRFIGRLVIKLCRYHRISSLQGPAFVPSFEPMIHILFNNRHSTFH